MEPDLVVIIAKQKAGYSDFWMWRHAKQRGRRTHAVQALYESHKHWAEEAREYVQSERKFNDAMDGHGVTSSKINNKKFYHLVLKYHVENLAGTRGVFCDLKG